MKKRISAVLLSLLFSVACLGGCGKKTYELPWDQCCASIHPPRQITMNGEERKYLVDTLNGCEWADGVSNCACDFVFYMQEQEVQYHSDCGTLNDVTRQKTATVSEEQRAVLNGFLGVLPQKSNKRTNPVGSLK